MSETDLYQLLYDLFTSAVSILIISTITAGVSYKLLMSMVLTIFNFIMAKSDLMGVGSTVVYLGNRYIIKQISFRKIRLLKDNEIYMIPTENWKSFIVIETGL